MNNYVSVRRMLLPMFRKGVTKITGQSNIPKHGPYLIAANHIDFLDGFFISAVVLEQTDQPVYFITKTNNYWWTRVTIPIDPKHRSGTLDDALQYLHSGKIICNFIEGERNSSKHLLPGKTGTARMALTTRVPVLPIGLIGTSSRNFLSAVANAMDSGMPLTMHIGKPIDFSDLADRPHDHRSIQVGTQRIMRALAPLTGKSYSA